MKKSEFMVSLKDKGLLLEGNIRTMQETKSDNINDARYDYLKHIRRVIVEDVKTGEIIEYTSLYKAS